MPNNQMKALTIGGTTYDIVDETSGYAKLASPTFTGTPTAPTPTSGDSSTKIATTAFVQDAMSGTGLEVKIKTVGTNATLVAYGQYRQLEFHSYVPTSTTFFTLDTEDCPNNTMNAVARWTNTSTKYFPANLRVGTDGAVSAAYFDSNTSTNAAISNGTLIGQVSWVVI